MQTKTCTKCGHNKLVDEFPKDAKGLYGVRGNCKVCDKLRKRTGSKESHRRYDSSEKGKERASRYRKNHSTSLNDYKRELYQRNIENERIRRRNKYRENAEIVLERSRQYKSANPDKRKSQHAVLVAVRRGDMPKAADCMCVQCGLQAKEYHHPSYAPEDRLKVVPLCKSCHVRVHKGTLALEVSI